MGDIVEWAGYKFYAKPTMVRSISTMTINASVETEDTTVDGQKFVKRKNANGYQIQMTAILDKRLNVDAQGLAVKLAECARTGATGYFYAHGNKLFPCKFMMTEAKLQNIIFSPNGIWISCEVAMTLKQCSKYDGTTASTPSASPPGGGGGGGGNSKKKNPGLTIPLSAADKAKIRKENQAKVNQETKAAGAESYIQDMKNKLKEPLRLNKITAQNTNMLR